MSSQRRALLPLPVVAVLLAGASIACETTLDDAQSILSETEGLGPMTAGPSVVSARAGAPPEAISLRGSALYPLAMDSAAEAKMREQLDGAMAAAEANPDDPEALIWVGRRQAYLGQYRDAIQTFTTGIEQHPGDPRFYRHRGHRYITVRELRRAIEDLEHAARVVSGQRDVVEPDGQPNPAGVPRSTLQTNIWYHLGLARYVAGDFTGAAHAFRRGLQISPNDDMRVAMADWLWLAYRRLGEQARAAALLDDVLTEDMEILENQAYHQRLRLYAGQVEPDSLLPERTDGLAVATYGYGLGTWHLVRGDTAAALEVYGDLLNTGYWPAFGYLAAEAELARLTDTKE